MGSLTYDSMVFEFEDRVLAHLQIVIVNKLRKGEPFLMSWLLPAEAGSGRGSIWLEPSIPLYFQFEGSRAPAIDRAWLGRLIESADSSQGLIVMGEDDHPPAVGRPVPLGQRHAVHPR